MSDHDSETLTWSSQSDWDAAQDREGVVSRDLPGSSHSAGTLRLGWDPQYGVTGDAELYWPLGDSTSTTVEVMHGRNGSVNGPSIISGPLDTGMHEFDDVAEDDIVVSNAPELAHSGSFSWGAMIRIYPDPEWDNFSFPFGAGVTDAGDWRVRRATAAGANERIGFHVHELSGESEWSWGHTNQVIVGELHHVIIVFDDPNDLLRVYLNREEDDAIIDADRPTGPSSAIMGRWALAETRYFLGELGHVHYWDYALSAAEAQEHFDALEHGTLTTATKTAHGAAEELTTTASIPSGTSIEVTVRQIIDGVTYSQSHEIDDGTNSYPLSVFDDTHGVDSDYYLDIELENGSSEWAETPTLSSAEIEVIDPDPFNPAEPVGYFPVSIAGVSYDVPLYDPQGLEDPSPTLTATNGARGRLYAVDPEESALQYSFDFVVHGALLDETDHPEWSG